MLTRRGFIVAGGGTIATFSLVGAGHAGMARTGGDAMVVYSKARIPAPNALARSHVLLGDDLTANLLNLEKLIRQDPARPLVLELDAADEMLFAIARTNVATHAARAGTAAQAAVV